SSPTTPPWCPRTRAAMPAPIEHTVSIAPACTPPCTMPNGCRWCSPTVNSTATASSEASTNAKSIALVNPVFMRVMVLASSFFSSSSTWGPSSKEPLLLASRQRQRQMLVRVVGHHAAARSARQKPLLQEVRLVHVFERIARLGERSCQRVDADRATFVMLDD